MTPGQSDDITSSETTEAAAMLDALGDAVAREILSNGSQRIVTVDELAEKCGVSEATVYRRLRELHSLGLVEKCTSIEAGVVTSGAYRTTVDSFTVRITPRGLEIDHSPTGELTSAVQTIRDAVDVDEVNYDPSSNSVQVAFRVDDDDQFKTYLAQYLG